MEWGPLLLAIISLASVLVKTWQDGAPQRAEGERNAEINQGRADISTGNVGAVSIRIDGVQSVQTGTAAGNPEGLSNDSDTARRLAAITNV